MDEDSALSVTSVKKEEINITPDKIEPDFADNVKKEEPICAFTNKVKLEVEDEKEEFDNALDIVKEEEPFYDFTNEVKLEVESDPEELDTTKGNVLLELLEIGKEEPLCDYAGKIKLEVGSTSEDSDKEPSSRDSAVVCVMKDREMGSIQREGCADASVINDVPFKCKIRDSESACQNSYNNNLSEHSDDDLLNCAHCDYKTILKTNLICHMRKHMEFLKQNKYGCNSCQYEASNPKCLKLHMKIHTRKKLLNCSVCLFKTWYASTLHRHMELHSEERLNSNSRQSKCIKSSDKRALKKCTEQKRFSCKLCDYSTSRSDHLKLHKTTHSIDKPFVCDVCSLRFVRQTHLNSHKDIHKGEKNFKCTVCEYKFIRLGNLNEHMKIHSGEKSFCCELCGYKSCRIGNMRSHMKMHSGEKPYACKLCSYKSSRLDHLKTHTKTHTEGSVYSCNMCEHRTSSSRGMNAHKLSHVT